MHLGRYSFFTIKTMQAIPTHTSNDITIREDKQMQNNAIAIIGGTFNPIHNGHVHIAHTVKEALNIKEVIFIPAGISVFKPHAKHNKYHRLNMVKLALSDYPYFNVSDIEINNNDFSYTINTIQQIKELYKKDIYFIIGTDALEKIFNWKNINNLFNLCKFVIINRPSHNLSHNIITKMKKMGATIHLLDTLAYEVSSSYIRQRIICGYEVGHLINYRVNKYIKENTLYTFNIENVKQILKKNLSKERYEHVNGVCKEATKLANTYNVSEKKAYIAALFHDFAKEYTVTQLREECEKYNYIPDQYIEQEMGLCHGFLAAEIAKKDFNIEDEDILNAIRYHTTGRRGMSTLEKVVFIADAIEPTRGDTNYLQILRTQAYEDINQALLTSLNKNYEKSQEKGFIYHPLGLQAIEDLKCNI